MDDEGGSGIEESGVSYSSWRGEFQNLLRYATKGLQKTQKKRLKTWMRLELVRIDEMAVKANAQQVELYPLSFYL